jgi:hypothetical protein
VIAAFISSAARRRLRFGRRRSSLLLLPLSQAHSRAATVLVDELDAGGFQARAYAIGLVTGTTSATESTPVRALGLPRDTEIPAQRQCRASRQNGLPGFVLPIYNHTLSPSRRSTARPAFQRPSKREFSITKLQLLGLIRGRNPLTSLQVSALEIFGSSSKLAK